MSVANVPPVPQEAYDDGLFIQELAPIRGTLVGSFFVAVIPLLVVLLFLGAFRLPAHFASLSGLIVWYYEKKIGVVVACRMLIPKTFQYFHSHLWIPHASTTSFPIHRQWYRLCQLAHHVDCC